MKRCLLCLKDLPLFEQYYEAINKGINYIVEGDIYIANMTRQIIMESQVQPYKVFLRFPNNI